MSSAPATSTPANDPPALGWQAELLREDIADLGELKKAAIAITRDIQRRSGEIEPGQMVPPISLGHAAKALAHTSRAARLAVMLRAKLADKLAAIERGEAGDDPVEPDDEAADDGDPSPRVPSRADQVSDRVPADLDRLERDWPLHDAAERLDQDRFGRFLNRPPGEVIALIRDTLSAVCDDLGAPAIPATRTKSVHDAPADAPPILPAAGPATAEPPDGPRTPDSS